MRTKRSESAQTRPRSLAGVPRGREPAIALAGNIRLTAWAERRRKSSGTSAGKDVSGDPRSLEERTPLRIDYPLAEFTGPVCAINRSNERRGAVRVVRHRDTHAVPMLSKDEC